MEFNDARSIKPSVLLLFVLGRGAAMNFGPREW